MILLHIPRCGRLPSHPTSNSPLLACRGTDGVVSHSWSLNVALLAFLSHPGHTDILTNVTIALCRYVSTASQCVRDDIVGASCLWWGQSGNGIRQFDLSHVSVETPHGYNRDKSQIPHTPARSQPMFGARGSRMLSAEWEAKERVICDVANPIERSNSYYTNTMHGLTETHRCESSRRPFSLHSAPRLIDL